MSFLFIASALVLPPASADFPWDEAGDVAWCADIASRTLRDAIDANVDHYGRTITSNYYSLKCKLRTHAPIVINGDPTTTDRVKLLTDYGIIEGTGTAADPYVIQGWSIVRSQHLKVYTPTSSQPTIVPLPATPATPIADWGIQLLQVKKHYIIDGVHVEGFRCDDQCVPLWENRGAIRIRSAQGLFENNGLHVTVRGSALLENDRGVFVTDIWSDGSCPSCPAKGTVTVTGNTITAQGYGIYLKTAMHEAVVTDNQVEHITIARGPYTDGYMGLIMDSARSSTVSNNRFLGVFQGIYLGWSAGVFGNGNTVCASIPYTDEFARGSNWVQYTRVGGCELQFNF